MLVFLTTGGSHPQMALLYGDVDLHEAGEMVDALDKAHIPHELAGQGDKILVPAADVLSARLLLAKSGLPSGGSVGYEIFDRADSLTQTQFEQTINQTRALEGELTRSIVLIHGIHAARVHLVLPHRAPFASEAQPSQASVLLSMNGSARLDPEGVQAIQTLVVAAVPELKPQNVSIIDSRGNVLARAGAPTGTLGEAATTDDLRQAAELRISRSVEDMLTPSLGAGNVRAEAAVTMDAEQTRETQESYNPDQQVLRSQQTTSDKSRNTDAAQNTSVSNNLPNANAGQTPSGSQSDREQETNNYEIGKTVRTVVNDQPRVGRLTVSVLVNGIEDHDKTGAVIWKPRPQAELDQISSLVKNAIGFDAKRGDAVTVASMRFTSPEFEAIAPPPKGPFGLSIASADLFHLGQTALLGIFVLLALLFVIRPTMLRLASGRTERDPALTSETTAVARIDAAPTAAITHDEQTPQLPAAHELMINIARVDGQLRASSLRQLSDLVRAHPMESLNIVRGWLGHEVS